MEWTKEDVVCEEFELTDPLDNYIDVDSDYIIKIETYEVPQRNFFGKILDKNNFLNKFLNGSGNVLKFRLYAKKKDD